MPRFAANLSLLFTEVDFLDRFQAAAQAGFRGVEYLFPYAWDKAELAARLKEHGLTQVLHNLPAGHWDAGERGIACLPGREAEFHDQLGLGIEYARALGCPRVNCLAGILPQGLDRVEARHTLVANLRFAAAELQKAGILLVMEAINQYDMPGFFVSRTADALDILADVGSDNLKLQYDIYHAQRTEGELGNTLSRHLAHIGHIQMADNPGRHEPGTGEINFPWLFRHLDAIGYQGWVGCEYHPLGTTTESLGWLQSAALPRRD